MTTIYTPDDIYTVARLEHPGDYGDVQDFLSLDGEDILALAVADNGRVYYHYAANGHMAFNFDLLEADFKWDAQRLDEWLLRPRDYLPGNKMSFVGIAAEQDRRDVIAFLKVETGYEAKPAE